MALSRSRGSAACLTRIALLSAVVSFGSSCSWIKGMALKSVANTLAETGTTVTSHNDPETVKGALPPFLLLYESLLESIPRHEKLLIATCSAYTQYAYGFVAIDAEALQWDDFDKSRVMNERALTLAIRGRDYCWRALEVRYKGITARLKADPVAAVARAKKDQVPLLYWSAASLGAAISLGGVGRPELLVDWPIVRALAERALALDETWSNGAIHEVMLTVESQGAAMGGSEERARRHFARAVELQQGLSPSPYISLAMGISVAKEDRAEFTRLLNEAIAIDPEKKPETRLATIIMRERAKRLLAHVDDFFSKLAVLPDRRMLRAPREE
jgi:hypothetical protein